MTDNIQEAIELIKSGKKADGGRILSVIVKKHPDTELAWQWLSVCVVPEEQKRYCLNQVLRINPQNVNAKKALESLDFQPIFEQTIQPHLAPNFGEPAIEKDTKLCKFCKSSMSIQATTCPHCGQYTGPGAVTSQIGSLTIQIGTLLLTLYALYYVWQLFFK
jgi:hypothetical protein